MMTSSTENPGFHRLVRGARVIKSFNDLGAIRNEHFPLRANFHSGTYLDKSVVFAHPLLLYRWSGALADAFRKSGANVVVAPATGGISLSTMVAYQLTQMRQYEEVLSIYAEKDGDAFTLRRGGDGIVAGKQVLVLEDISTTGGTAKLVVEAIRAAGGTVVGVGIVWNRGRVTTKDVGGVPKLFSLVDVPLPMWSPRECPMCAAGIPLTDPHRGRAVVAPR